MLTTTPWQLALHHTSHVVSHPEYQLVAASHAIEFVILTDMSGNVEDSILVKTPVLTVPFQDEFEVQGHAIVGQYAPLSSNNVEHLLGQE